MPPWGTVPERIFKGRRFAPVPCPPAKENDMVGQFPAQDHSTPFVVGGLVCVGVRVNQDLISRYRLLLMLPGISHRQFRKTTVVSKIVTELEKTG